MICKQGECRYRARDSGWCKRHDPALSAARSAMVRAAHRPAPEAERFWSKVAIGANDDCWQFTGSVATRGYGSFRGSNGTELAHRVAFRLHHGQEAELCVLHRCDNPPCCNPAHLWEGSRADNNRDMHDKVRNRQPRGEQHPNRKLSDEAVREIRKAGTSRSEQRALAVRFGVTRSAILYVQRGGWAHVE